MIKINNLKCPIDHDDELIKSLIVKKLGVDSSAITGFKLIKRSLDARKKPELIYILSLEVNLDKNVFDKLRKKIEKGKIRDVSLSLTEKDKRPYILKNDILIPEGVSSPVIVGFGPAGLFAALSLSRMGLKPVIFERGSEVNKRKEKCDIFFEGGDLDTSSNVLFGEGGAGTFSDGKLNTGNKDRSGYFEQILKTFVSFGAPEEILYDAKPHIGTDILKIILENIRKELISLGATIRFDTKVDDLLIKDGKISGVILENKDEVLTDTVILSTGHSARDTFEMLCNKGVAMESKPFAVGFRIEHEQEMINRSQYGGSYRTIYGDKLQNASYKLVSSPLSENRRAYSFCMCPGGYVINSSSEENALCVNGMSYSKRDGINANAAIVVSVDKKDFGPDDNVLSGIEYQRKIERKTFELCNGSIPVQRLGDFIKDTKTKDFGSVLPYTLGRYERSNLRGIYSDKIEEAFLSAMKEFGQKIQGYDMEDALLFGSETRTSSPVRIIRDEKSLESININGLYPCGEGAGYAGGILSAAADGIKVSERIINRFIKDE